MVRMRIDGNHLNISIVLTFFLQAEGKIKRHVYNRFLEYQYELDARPPTDESLCIDLIDK